jgi:hypothetical protein
MFFYLFALVSLVAAVLAVTRKNAPRPGLVLSRPAAPARRSRPTSGRGADPCPAPSWCCSCSHHAVDLRTEVVRAPSDAALEGPGAGGRSWDRFAVLASKVELGAQPPALEAGAGAIGEALFNRWILAFEVTSFLLLGAILGAVVLTKKKLS